MPVSEQTVVEIKHEARRLELPSYMTMPYSNIDHAIGDLKSSATTAKISDRTPSPVSSIASHRLERTAVEGLPARAVPENPRLEVEAILIIRAQLMKPILNNLEMASRHAGTPFMARYIDGVVRAIRKMRDVAPRDPMTFVVLALHDALTYENNWADYNSEQYLRASEILRQLHASAYFTSKAAEQGILDLELAGFSTFPFEISFDSEEAS